MATLAICTHSPCVCVCVLCQKQRHGYSDQQTKRECSVGGQGPLPLPGGHLPFWEQVAGELSELAQDVMLAWISQSTMSAGNFFISVFANTKKKEKVVQRTNILFHKQQQQKKRKHAELMHCEMHYSSERASSEDKPGSGMLILITSCVPPPCVLPAHYSQTFSLPANKPWPTMALINTGFHGRLQENFMLKE